MPAVPSARNFTEDAPLPSSGVSDWLFRRLFKAIGRLTFSSSNDLKVVLGVGTGSTLATGYVALGDSSKNGTLMIVTRQGAAVSTRRNLIRS